MSPGREVSGRQALLVTVTPNPSVDRVWYIPGFRPGGAHRVVRSWAAAGGKGCNVARAALDLARAMSGPAGCPRVLLRVVATGFLAGTAGDFVERDLAGRGVRVAFVRLAGGETRTCPTIVDTLSGEVTEIREPGPALALADAGALEERLASLLGEAEAEGVPAVVTLSGGLPREAPKDLYARLIRAAARRRVPCVLDTSGEPLAAGVGAGPWAVKVNEEELKSLALDPAARAGIPGETAERDLAARLQALGERGVRLAVATRGRQGLLAYDGRTLWRGTLPGELDVVQPVGSGDAATAALAVRLAGWLARGALQAGDRPDLGLVSVPEPERMGVIRDMAAAGAANATTEGIATCPRDVFRAMRERARIEPVSFPPRAGRP